MEQREIPPEQRTWVVHERDWQEAKHEDTIAFKHDGVDFDHFAAKWSIVHRYLVQNLRPGKENSKYVLLMWWSMSGKYRIASCNCPAYKICKHLSLGVKHHNEQIQAGFLPEDRDLTLDV